MIAACGGGSTAPTVAAPAPTVAAPASTSATSVKVSGTVTYDSVPNTAGPLQYSAMVSKPVRGAQIELVNSASQNVVASAVTDGSGNYDTEVPRGTVLFVRVLATLLQDGSGPTWDTSVRDNTRDDSVYALESDVFSTTDATPVRKDVHAASGWGGNAYTTARAAGPFAILDVIYLAQAAVLSVAPRTQFAPLKLFWSTSNTPAAGDIALGQIESSHFEASLGTNSIYLLGKADVDTDEYDVSVVAHEWGHYLQANFGRADSPGGNHGFADLVDFRVAFSEGWATGISGIVLARSTYCDSNDVGQGRGLFISLAAGANGVKGWFRETSIQHVVWQLNNLAGFKPLFDAMTGAMKTQVPLSSIHAFNAALKLASSTAAASFAPLLASENIDPDADAWGAGETNDGGAPMTLPLYRAVPLGPAATRACVTNTFGATPADNKLGNYTYLRFVVAKPASYQIRVSDGGSGTQPEFQIYGGTGLVAQALVATPTQQALQVALDPAEYVLALTDAANLSPSSCFNVTIN